AAKWEAWAKRANVLPWIWDEAPAAAAGGSKETRFELKQGDELTDERAPSLAGKGLVLRVELSGPVAEGVLVAQGGTADGFSLYVKSGKLVLGVRRQSELETVATKEALPKEPGTVTATLEKDGSVTLTAGDKEAGRGKVAGTVGRQPKEGLQVGSDRGGAVGDYKSPFRYGGKLGKGVLELVP